MSISRVELRQMIVNLSNSNIENAEKHLENIYKNIINKYITEQKRIEEFAAAAVQETKDEFYDLLTETYNDTSKAIGSMYRKVKPFSVKDVFKLTYTADGKTLEQRIKIYWKDAEESLRQGNSIQDVKFELFRKITLLLRNETAVVESVIKQNKIPINATILVIEGGCSCGDGYCSEQVGEYPADEDPPGGYPPYHPGCDCSFYYEETDDPDDVNDLDLEIDKLGPLAEKVEEIGPLKTEIERNSERIMKNDELRRNNKK